MSARHKRDFLPFPFSAAQLRAMLRFRRMKDDVGDNLTWAAASILRPLVTRLLARGVPFGRVEARLRELFVEVAATELRLPGRRQTDSRVSLLTGINRKEVRRIRATERRHAGPRSFSMNHVTSVMSR